MAKEQPKPSTKMPVTAFSPDEWNKMSPAEKQRFCDEYNAHVNKKRAARGLPPLK